MLKKSVTETVDVEVFYGSMRDILSLWLDDQVIFVNSERKFSNRSQDLQRFRCLLGKRLFQRHGFVECIK